MATMPLFPAQPAAEPAPGPWGGWWRQNRRQRWTLLCRAATEDDCWTGLWKLAPHGGEQLVTQKDPNARRPR
jgi:hypothetical protein